MTNTNLQAGAMQVSIPKSLTISISPQLASVLRNSTFTVRDEKFVYAKVSKLPEPSKYYITAPDPDGSEITVIGPWEKIRDLAIVERNKEDYAWVSLNVSVPFYCVGFMAAVNTAIANAGVDLLDLSLYSKDHFLVKASEVGKAVQALALVGLTEARIEQ